MQFERAEWDLRRDDEDTVSVVFKPSAEGGIFVASFRSEMSVGTTALIHGLDEVEGRGLEAGEDDILEYRLRELSAGVFSLYNCTASIVNGNRTTPCSDGILREFAPLSRGQADTDNSYAHELSDDSSPIQTFNVEPPTEDDIARHNEIVAQIRSEE